MSTLATLTRKCPLNSKSLDQFSFEINFKGLHDDVMFTDGEIFLLLAILDEWS